MLIAALLLTFFQFDQAPDDYLSRQVEVVGFLVSDEKGDWHLAREPNIKTCCIGKKSEIRLTGSFPSDLKGKVVRVSGVLQRDGGYVLEGSKLIIQK